MGKRNWPWRDHLTRGEREFIADYDAETARVRDAEVKRLALKGMADRIRNRALQRAKYAAGQTSRQIRDRDAS